MRDSLYSPPVPLSKLQEIESVLGQAIRGKPDEEFLSLANTSSEAARLIWIRLGNCRTKVLLDAIGVLWPRIEAGLKRADRIIEVR
jgi:predicted nuclease of predicted toxin-antitoxin system